MPWTNEPIIVIHVLDKQPLTTLPEKYPKKDVTVSATVVEFENQCVIVEKKTQTQHQKVISILETPRKTAFKNKER